jgi:signal transduction histidine kinase
MRRVLFLLFILLNTGAFGQSAKFDGFNLDSLPAKVGGQWKFHAGDNPAWADSAYNDSAWNHLDPTQYLYFLPQVAQAQIGWFRLTINVGPQLRGKYVALSVNQYGAAEVFFNGVLLRRMGSVSADYKYEKTRRSIREPLTIQLTDAPHQYLAIRYSLNRNNARIGYGDPVIVANFRQPDTAWDYFFQEINFYTTRSWVSGCFMLLGILQLSIYFFSRERKINLYLSIYAFLQLFTLSDGLLVPLLPSNNWLVFFQTMFSISAPLEFVFLVAMAYGIFNYKRNWWFYFMAICCLPVTIVQFLADNADTEYVLAIYNIINYLTIIVISARAVREKRPSAALLLTGIMLSMTFFILFNLNQIAIEQTYLLENGEVAFAFLTPAIILAIMLAREFGHNLATLRQKLTELENLSARSLQQEIEKQQILARQNETLELKVSERTAKLNQSLSELKNAQRQLIQSEKMASLGELTAGIAHEIQNPLNFVNNFSEVSVELLGELKDEAEAGHTEDVITIADDLTGNLEKIRHHGKRADAIVKGMLEHSRAGSGQKEATDLNQLADEYLRLAYHGFQAKDKSFNAVPIAIGMVTHFDEKLPLVNVIPQDIGRVLLNLFNNAFYAVAQKAKTAGADYTPQITLETFFLPLLPGSPNGQGVGGLRVKDNGSGIPDAIKDKIMQPFFTTKPTGEGTGLGLSLSYDIVVKGHGGKIEVNTKENEFTEFTIILPL